MLYDRQDPPPRLTSNDFWLLREEPSTPTAAIALLLLRQHHRDHGHPQHREIGMPNYHIIVSVNSLLCRCQRWQVVALIENYEEY